MHACSRRKSHVSGAVRRRPTGALADALARTVARALALRAVALLAALTATFTIAAPVGAAAPAPRIGAAALPTAERALAREIYAELVSIPTTQRTGTTVAAEALARRFLDAGYPAADVVLAGPTPEKQNLVVRLRGAHGAAPVAYFAHLDVVEALKEAWTVPPFELTERDGWFYGRGTSDMKQGAAALAATMLRLRRERFVPRGDVIAAFTADEEGGPDNGADWLVKHRRELVAVPYAINLDGADIPRLRGRRQQLEISTGEKLYASYSLTVSNPGGHSSLPVPENAIYRLAAALTRLAASPFPIRLNDATRAMLDGYARRESGQAAADVAAVAAGRADEAATARVTSSPYLNAVLRTTCVATMVQAGHADNALPMRAKANVQCRLLPDEDVAAMPAKLAAIVADPQVEVGIVWAPIAAPASTLDPRVRATVQRVADEMWPGLRVVPTMAVGASDGTFLRGAGIPTFDVNGFYIDMEDVRAHGKDERLHVDSFYEGVDFQYRFMKALASR